MAEVSWQLNPDGRYYMDEDGYGMTNEKEITIFGFIDRNAEMQDGRGKSREIIDG